MACQSTAAIEASTLRPMMRTAIRALLICSIVVHGVACGGTSDDDETEATLSIDPPTVGLLILNNAPAKQDYIATLTFPDGHTKDVTSETLFTIDLAYGIFNGSTVAVQTAGKMQVFGQRED